MRLSKFLFTAVFITLFSLFYVWQQTEIFRLAYAGQKNFCAFQELLDKNAFLRYNIKRNASLVCIGNKVSEAAVFQMPDTYRLVKLINPEGNTMPGRQTPRRESLAFRIFGINRQAEAKTINP